MRRRNGVTLLALMLALAFGAEAFAQDNRKIIRRSTTSSSPIEILDAVFGQDERVCDARGDLVRACDGQSACEVRADTKLCGDPYRGVSKELFIAYSCGDGRRTLTVSEGEPARLYCSDGGETVFGPDAPRRTSTRGLNIIEVAYGADNRYCDATGAFIEECNGRRTCQVLINNRLCDSDPARGAKKDAYVRYSCRGDELEQVVTEDATVELRCD